MWLSRVATTWLYPPSAACFEMPAAAAAPPGRPSEPPSQKSFCTSTTISAVPMVELRSEKQRRDSGLAVRKLEALPRQADQAAAQPLPRVVERRQVRLRAASADQRDLQRPVVRLRLGRGPGG